MSKEIAEAKQTFSLAPRSIEEALKFADMLSKSNLVPKEFSGNSGNILVAIQWGMELGLQPMQAMQNIAVINGRPSLWGDSVIGIVKASPLCEYVVEEVNDKQAICRVKRRGEPEQIRTFTAEDARAAGLWGKQGPWTNYPKRMMQMRARSWALRDVFPDVLRGMPVAEELIDQQVKDVTPPPEIKEPVYYTNDEFGEKKTGWKEIVLTKKKDAASLIAFVESKGKLFTEDQKTEISTWKVIEQEPTEVKDPFVDEMNAEEGAK